MHTPARQSEIFLTRALGKTLRALALTCTLALSGILTLKQVQGTECPGGPFEPYVQAVGTEPHGYSPGAPSPGQALLSSYGATDGQAEGIAPGPILACRPPTIILKDAVLLAKVGTLKVSFVLRDEHVKGAYVTVNDSKVFFKYNARHTEESTFTAELPIGKGPNIVHVVGYDDQGLSTEKPFVITGM